MTALHRRRALRPSRLEPDMVRAAQNMIDAYGVRAGAVALDRSDNARDLDVVRRWRVIAQAIEQLQARRSEAEGRAR